VVDANNHLAACNGGQRCCHQVQYLEVRGCAVAAYDVKIALGKLPVASALGVLPAPDFGDMVTLKGKGQFRAMLCKKARKGNGKVKAKRHIPLSVVLKTVNLLFRFAAALAQKDFGVFQRRGVDRHKAVGAEKPLDFFHQIFARDFRRGQKVPKPFQDFRFNVITHINLSLVFQKIPSENCTSNRLLFLPTQG
jgi:hypothetical protein